MVVILNWNISNFTITGVTGQKSADINNLKKSIKGIKQITNLPIVAGFGIKNKNQISKICKITDGAVVGSAIIKIIQNNLNKKENILNLINKLILNLKKGMLS